MGHGKERTKDIECNVCYWSGVGGAVEWEPPDLHDEVCDRYHSDTESMEGCKDYNEEDDAENCDGVQWCETCEDKPLWLCDAHSNMEEWYEKQEQK
jgi:hypothetical protein